MSLELYNTTDKIKSVPKFRYNGKYTLRPFEAVGIEEYMTDFFAPYAKIGVVVRSIPVVNNETSDDITEGVVENAVSDEAAIEPVEEAVEDKTDDVSDTLVEEVKDEPTEEVTDATEETPEEEEVSEEKSGYTREELSLMTMKDLRELAASMDIDVSDIRRKDPLIDAIIGE